MKFVCFGQLHIFVIFVCLPSSVDGRMQWASGVRAVNTPVRAGDSGQPVTNNDRVRQAMKR